MKIKKSELNLIIENYLQEDETYDHLSEGRFGRITGGVNFEFCDLSRIPQILNDFLDAMRSKDLKKLYDALEKEKKKSNDPTEIASINAKLSEMQDNPESFLQVAVSHPLFSKMVVGTGYTLSFLTGLDKADCDYYIRTMENFTYNILVPLFGIKKDRVQGEVSDARAAAAAAGLGGAGVAGATALAAEPDDATADAGLVDMSMALKNGFVVNKRNERKRIPSKLYDSGLTQFDFDMFELMAPEEYHNFIEDPSKQIPGTIIDKLKNAYKILDRGTRGFAGLTHAFVMATPGVQDDQKVKRVFGKFPFDRYFKDPDVPKEKMRDSMNKLVKKLDIEGVQVFTSI